LKEPRPGEIYEVLKRTKQEGRFPLYPVARAEFCYHSLQRVCNYCITAASSGQLPGTRVLLQTLNSVTRSEYQSSLVDASDLLANFARRHPK
jgi:hypothetical protein